MDLIRGFYTHWMRVSSLPKKTRIPDKTVMTGKAHSLGAHHILTSGLLQGSRIIWNQGHYVITFEVSHPCDMTGCTFALLSYDTRGKCLHGYETKQKYQ
jgi:nitrate reductase assembly molybdenum cofactor insertion protein NarJ